MQKSLQNIIITGASSGLGYALALEYAKPNNKLFLFGRAKDRLLELQKICHNKQADTQIFIVDVNDQNIMSEIINDTCEAHKIDIVIACAGVSMGTLGNKNNLNSISQIFNTNILGVMNTIIPAIEYMKKQKSGHIVIVSSMAGLIPLLSSPAYSASKACVNLFAESIRSNLEKHHIHLSLVMPGYIDTPMTAVNNFAMPFKISSTKAAKIIVNGIFHKKRVIIFPKIIFLILKIINLLPQFIHHYIRKLIDFCKHE